MEFLKTVGGKIVGGIVALVVIAAAISWWRMDPAMRQHLLSNAGKIASWFGVVLFLPWATFFVIGRVGKMDSNVAGAALVFGYTALEMLLLAWLFNWSISGATQWTFMVFGGLLAAVYNLFTCDWIAEKVA
jgi:hypothetical protein